MVERVYQNGFIGLWLVTFARLSPSMVLKGALHHEKISYDLRGIGSHIDWDFGRGERLRPYSTDDGSKCR